MNIGTTLTANIEQDGIQQFNEVKKDSIMSSHFKKKLLKIQARLPKVKSRDCQYVNWR